MSGNYLQGTKNMRPMELQTPSLRPRMKAAVTGANPSGTPVPGEYDGTNKSGLVRAFADGFDENVEFFRLDFLDPDEVARGDAFKAIVPILWVIAGCSAEREESKGCEAMVHTEVFPFCGAHPRKAVHFFSHQSDGAQRH